MKRISLALAAIGLSAGVFAALPAATDPTIVSVPQLPGGFVVGGSGFYLQPTNSNGDLDYAAVNTVNSNGTVFGANLKNVDPGYDWGWGVNVGYVFPNTGNDVNLSYMQLDSSNTAHTSNAFPGITVVNTNLVISDGMISAASAKAEYDLDQVDLTAGQYIDVGCRLVLHPFAGLRWAQLDRTLNSGYIGSPTSASTVVNGSLAVHEESDFEGIGPIAGLDASYYVGMGFGVVGHVDSALLIGNIDAKNNAANFNPAGVQQGSFNYSASNTRRVVPVLDGKLGLDYTYVFNNAANSDLTLEAGWMVSNYFNAVDRLSDTITFTQGGGGTLASGARSTSDAAFQGPYVSLQFHA